MSVDTDNILTGQVIGAAIAVHREVGPGLDEPVYEKMLSSQLLAQGIRHECQAALPLRYKGVKLDCGYRRDLWIESRLVVELKSVETLLPIHDAQLLTYLWLTPCELGLLINFDVPVLKHGVHRRVWTAERNPLATDPPNNDSESGKFEPLSGAVLAAAVEVHRTLGRACSAAPTRSVCATNWPCGESSSNAQKSSPRGFGNLKSRMLWRFRCSCAAKCL